jgi:hypothetical protein
MRKIVKRLITMRSAYDPASFGEALRRSIDEERWTLFSLSGFEGSQPVLGEVGANNFRLQKRRYSRNDFCGHLFGEFVPDGSGTKIEAHFDMPRWARYFWRCWLAGAVVIGTIVFVQTLLQIRGSNPVDEGIWVGLLVPPMLIGCGILFPLLTRRFGRKDRRFMLSFIESVTATKVEDMEASVR